MALEARGGAGLSGPEDVFQLETRYLPTHTLVTDRLTMISRTHILASAAVLLFSVAGTCLLANRFSLRISHPR